MSFDSGLREDQLQQKREQNATRYFSQNSLPVPVPATGAAPLTGHTNSVTRVVTLDDGALLATACYDGRVRVYDAAGGASVPRHDLSGHNGLVLSLAPLGGSILVSGGWSDQVVSWNARTGARLDALRVTDSSFPSIAAVDEGKFVAGTGSGDLVFFSHSKGRGLREVDRVQNAHSAWINHIAVRGDLMVTASFDKTATLWHLPSRTRLATLPHTSNVWCAALSDRFLATGAQGEIRVYEIERDCALKLVMKGVHANEFVHAVALAGDDWLLSAGGDGAVTFTSLASEQPVVRVSTSVPYVLDIALLPNGRVAVCGNESNDCYSKVFPSPIGVESPLREYTATLFPNNVTPKAVPASSQPVRATGKSKSKKNKKIVTANANAPPQEVAKTVADEAPTIAEKQLPQIEQTTTAPVAPEPVDQAPVHVQESEPTAIAEEAEIPASESSETEYDHSTTPAVPQQEMSMAEKLLEAKVIAEQNDVGSLIQQWSKHDTPKKPKYPVARASPKRTETPARETLKKLTTEEERESPTTIDALIQQWTSRE